eukprot:287221_1
MFDDSRGVVRILERIMPRYYAQIPKDNWDHHTSIEQQRNTHDHRGKQANNNITRTTMDILSRKHTIYRGIPNNDGKAPSNKKHKTSNEQQLKTSNSYRWKRSSNITHKMTSIPTKRHTIYPEISNRNQSIMTEISNKYDTYH